MSAAHGEESRCDLTVRSLVLRVEPGFYISFSENADIEPLSSAAVRGRLFKPRPGKQLEVDQGELSRLLQGSDAYPQEQAMEEPDVEEPEGATQVCSATEDVTTISGGGGQSPWLPTRSSTSWASTRARTSWNGSSRGKLQLMVASLLATTATTRPSRLSRTGSRRTR